MSTNRIRAFLVAIVIALVVIATSTYLYFELKSNRVEKIARDEGVIRILFLFQSQETLKGATLVFFGANTLEMGSLYIPRNTAVLRKNPSRMLPLDSEYTSRNSDFLVGVITDRVQTSIHYSVVVDIDRDLPRLIDLVKGIILETPSGRAKRIDGDSYTDLLQSEEIDYQEVLIALLLQLGKDADEYTTGPGFSLLRSYISTDMSRDSLRSLLGYIERGQTSSSMHFAIEGNLRAVNGVDELLLFPYEDGSWIRDGVSMLNTVLQEALTIHPFVISVEILNGTSREGLAQRTAQYLRSQGFQSITYANAVTNDIPFSHVEGSAVDTQKLQYVQEVLNIRNTDYVTSLTRNFDVTIVLGQDFDESVIQ